LLKKKKKKLEFYEAEIGEWAAKYVILPSQITLAG
jgi:hypothetical protein